MTAKNPSDTWFYNDWENDEKLKACSLAAQGLWKRLLCIAARSLERGVVQIGSLNCSRTEGLAHIASAVGRPPHEIAPLIDELVSSGAASVDRKGRIFNRRMVQTAKVSAARAQSGQKGAEVTNEKRWGKAKLGQQTVDKPSPSSSLHPPRSPTHGITDGVAASAPAPGGARSPIGNLPDSAKWAARLAGYKPWLGLRVWHPFWGARPDASGNPNQSIPKPMLAAWFAERAAFNAKDSA